jgi:carboxymethylenebutenolidase
MGQLIELTASDKHTLSAYLAEPAKSPRGGIVVVQEIFGVNQHIREVTDNFSKEGYLAIAPALFDRAERNVELGYGPDDRDKGIATRAGVKWEDAIKDIISARNAISEAGKVGIVGYCYGGTVAWLGACKGGFDAASGYYGGGVHENLDLIASCPVELHFGAEDQGIPQENVNLIQTAKPDINIYIYESAGHGFVCDQRPTFHPEAAKLANSRTLDFFQKHIG